MVLFNAARPRSSKSPVPPQPSAAIFRNPTRHRAIVATVVGVLILVLTAYLSYEVWRATRLFAAPPNRPAELPAIVLGIGSGSLTLAVLLRFAHKGLRKSDWPATLHALTPAQECELSGQIRGTSPLVLRTLSTTRALALAQFRVGALWPAYAGLAANSMANTLDDPTRIEIAVGVIIAAVFVKVMVHFRRQRLQSRAFLAAHSAAEVGAGSA